MIILDTNVLSELMRPQPSPIVSQWIATQPISSLFTSSITEAEIFYGIELLPKSSRREALRAAAESMFTMDFSGRILAFGSDAARVFSRIAAHRRQLGRPISQPDAQIAAIARVRGAWLATRNGSDFADCGLQVINPWIVS